MNVAAAENGVSVVRPLVAPRHSNGIIGTISPSCHAHTATHYKYTHNIILMATGSTDSPCYGRDRSQPVNRYLSYTTTIVTKSCSIRIWIYYLKHLLMVTRNCLGYKCMLCDVRWPLQMRANACIRLNWSLIRTQTFPACTAIQITVRFSIAPINARWSSHCCHWQCSECRSRFGVWCHLW